MNHLLLTSGPVSLREWILSTRALSQGDRSPLDLIPYCSRPCRRRASTVDLIPQLDLRNVSPAYQSTLSRQELSSTAAKTKRNETLRKCQPCQVAVHPTGPVSHTRRITGPSSRNPWPAIGREEQSGSRFHKVTWVTYGPYVSDAQSADEPHYTRCVLTQHLHCELRQR